MAKGISQNLKRYFKEIRHLPVLTREEETALVLRVREGCAESLNRLVESNLRFAAKVVGEYADYAVPFEDLIGEANLGLIEAAKRFDPDRGVRFISYAVWWIRRAVLTALREQAGVVRLPESQIRRMRQVKDTEQRLTRELGRPPSEEELSDTLPPYLSELDPLDRNGVRTIDVDAPVDLDGGETLADALPDEALTSAERSLLDREAVRNVTSVLDTLSPRERKVLDWRFGLGDEPPLTLREVARRIDRSREAVRVIEQKACKRLGWRLTYEVYAIRRPVHQPRAKAS